MSTDNPTNKTSAFKYIQRYVLNKYVITFVLFLVWIILFDNSSLLVINDLNSEIKKYESQLEHYKSEYEKHSLFYNTLMENKDEKERFARENYFMKKPDEEIFILVADSVNVKN